MGKNVCSSVFRWVRGVFTIIKKMQSCNSWQLKVIIKPTVVVAVIYFNYFYNHPQENKTPEHPKAH